jgi:hypothetical protein
MAIAMMAQCIEEIYNKDIGIMKLIKPLLAGLIAIVVVSGIAVSAHATQINGTIGFTSAAGSSGGSASVDGSGNVTIHFNNPLHVNFGTDDYSTTVGSAVNFASFTFDSGGNLLSPNVPEWTFTVGTTVYSFDLLSLSTASFHTGSPNALAVMGEGTAHITGFDDTFATFSLQGTGRGFTFTILQASNTAVPNVPDSGSAVALLGLGLVALEGLRRKLAA